VRAEAAAQVDGGREADARRDRLHRQVRLLKQRACRGDPAREQPRAGAGAELVGEAPGQRARRDAEPRGKFVH
jgi:hypothetical protein